MEQHPILLLFLSFSPPSCYYDYDYFSRAPCALGKQRGWVIVRRDMLLLKEPYPDLHGICPPRDKKTC